MNLKESVQNLALEKPFLDEIVTLRIAISDELEKFNNIPKIKFDLNKIKEKLTDGLPVLHIQPSIIDYDNLTSIFKGLSSLKDNKNLPDEFCNACAGLNKMGIDSQTIKMVLMGKTWHMLTTTDASLANYLLWNCVTHYLKNIMPSLEQTVKDVKWVEGYCPICGNQPVMAFLKKTDRGRERFLLCGHCNCSWSYARLQCPYCENSDQKTLGVIEVEEEPDIRADVCKKCNSYIKTYVGKNKTALELEDWATIHIDMLFKAKGYQKLGALMIAD